MWRAPLQAPVDEIVAWVAEPTSGPRPPHLLLIGVAGTGKSLALSSLVARCPDAVLASGGVGTPLPEPNAPGGVWLVDDAHLMNAEQAERLVAVSQHSAVVLAARPWPESEVLNDLLAHLPGHRVAHLQPWDFTELASYVEAHEPSTSPHQVTELHRLSAGFPWLATRIMTSVADAAPEARSRIRSLSPEARSLVEELAVGFVVDDCPTGAQVEADSFDELLAEVDAAGLMTNAGLLAAAVAEVATADLPVHRRRRLQRQALDMLPTEPGADPDRFRRLANTGLREERLVAGLTQLGDECLTTDPATAEEWYDMAVRAGATQRSLWGRRAESALRLGRATEAAAVVDEALTDDEPPDATRIIGVALALNGRLGIGPRIPDLIGWLGEEPTGSVTAAAVTVLLARGCRDAAEDLIATYRRRTPGPTTRESVAALVIDGLADSLAVDPVRALAKVMQSTQLMRSDAHGRLSPMHPALLAGTIALHTGEYAVAAAVLQRGMEGMAPDWCWYRRFQHLAAWTAMMRGELTAAEKLRQRARSGPFPMATRDEFWDLALGVGLARRGDRLHDLAREWEHAADRLMSHSVDLFDILALSEIHIAGVRVRDTTTVQPELTAMAELLTGMGCPPLWSAALHWAVVQGAVLGRTPEGIAPHADALQRAARGLPFAVPLAAAARAWQQVLSRDFDTDRVIAVAQGLRDAGQRWEGGRLAGHAAAMAQDRRDTARLLETARALDDVRDQETDTGTEPSSSVVLANGTTHLSVREQQVVQLVLAGHTYREVGAQLFLSDRTVEHHMARIRRRMGAGSRGELLSLLADAMGQLNGAQRRTTVGEPA